MFCSDCESAAASSALCARSSQKFSRKDVRLKERLANHHLLVETDSEPVASQQEDRQPPVHPLSARGATQVREVQFGKSCNFLFFA